MLNLIILSLAAYRLTHLLVIDVLFNRFRSLFVVRSQGTYKGKQMMFFELQGGPVRQFFGKVLNCFWCCGVWASGAIVAAYLVAPDIMYWVCLWLAMAAVQSLLETVWAKQVGWPLDMPPADMMDRFDYKHFFKNQEDGGVNNEMPAS